MPSASIFGINYAPEPAGNSPYTTSVAEHLARSGWNVTVHAGMPHYPQWQKTITPSGTRNGVRVIRHNHFVPRAPTTMGRGLMEASWTASTLGQALRASTTDVILGVVPSLSGAWLAHRAAKRSKAPLVLWIQDLMGQAAAQGGVAGANRVAGLVAATELRTIRHADRILVCASGFADYLTDRGIDVDHIELVRNWGLLPAAASDRTTTLRRHDLDPKKTIAVHSGNMGSKQGLDVVVDAARLAPDVTFVLQGNGGERPRLAAASTSLANVEFLPTLESQDLADILAAADVLLLTQRDTVTDMSLPSKLTSYFTAGRPIVAAINPASEAADVLRRVERSRMGPAGNARRLVDNIKKATTQTSSFDSIPDDVFGSPVMIEEILGSLINS